MVKPTETTVNHSGIYMKFPLSDGRVFKIASNMMTMDQLVYQANLLIEKEYNDMKFTLRKDLCNCGKPECYICGSFKSK